VVIDIDFWESAARAWGKSFYVSKQERERKIHEIAAISVKRAVESMEKNETKKAIPTALDFIFSEDEDDDEFI